MLRGALWNLMTESDLDRLMIQGARRLRLQHAVVVALVVFGLSVLAAAVATFAVRLFMAPGALGNFEDLLVHGALTAPLAAGVIALFASYYHYQPAPARVAMTLDRGGASHEHLVTWLEYRSRKIDGELQQGFRAAQLAATLKCAEHFNARKLIPVRLPDWSRALWMSILLLCCAWLMPPRAAVRQIHIVETQAKPTLTLKSAGDASADDAASSQTPRVEVLNPTDLFDLQLKASDPELSQSARNEALQELLKKIGHVPEGELTPEVRELLNAFRNGKDSKAAAKDDTDGSKQLNSKAAPVKEDTAATELGVPAALPAAREKAITVIESQFTDVREQLERYYQSVPKKDAQQKGVKE